MNINRDKIIKMVLILGGLCILVSLLTQVSKHNSYTLQEYAEKNPEIAYQPKPSDDETAVTKSEETTTAKSATEEMATTETTSKENLAATPTPQDIVTENLQNSETTGALLNGNTLIEQRISHVENEAFYYEPLSDNLRRYITGVSYPAISEPAISYDELSYLHLLHYDFDGNLAEGELICNQLIAQDLLEIFYELYRNEYQLEKVRLIDEYDGDDIASMEDNNTSCFNYRVIEGSTSLSKHALGLALDINPLYNPHITYEKDGSQNISPASAAAYADRTAGFPYKIDENDLCYKLFIKHGFTWGGNWNSSKDYQHFQKAVQ